MNGAKRRIVAAAMALMCAAPAAADQTDPELDTLFARLLDTADPSEAQSLESRIWMIWMTSDEKSAEALMEEGTLLMRRRRYVRALEAFNKLVEQYPDIAEGWNKRATLYYLIGEYDRSAADIRKTLILEPRHFGALSGLGLINMALERDEAAEDAFEAALRINPHLRGARTNLEEVRGRLKRKEI